MDAYALGPHGPLFPAVETSAPKARARCPSPQTKRCKPFCTGGAPGRVALVDSSGVGVVEWSSPQARGSPPTGASMTAARVLGIGRTKAYELARAGEFPVHAVRIGDLYRLSTADLLRFLRADHADA
ncbi:helix-turn-helix domain-containing protein [Nocardiopsis sp. NPDC058631]|uniref:helix-turn-helix domain-containing protein n=1 Tax=Nocardiopsis sp. NPDC058631 TaxID=3346566 RepID=UPI003652D0E5